MTLWAEISKCIGDATGAPFGIAGRRHIGGGCINNAVVIEDAQREFFVKHNDAGYLDMFQAEAEGLAALAATAELRIPKTVGSGVADGSAYLVLEFIDLDRAAERPDLLGLGLAALHRHTHTQFGWRRDNYIGKTPQRNAVNSDWATFWRDARLVPQFKLAESGGQRGRLLDHGQKLLADMEVFFRDYRPQASLLHGDLWSGNYAYDTGGKPVLFDPAVYYGDRETDIAMTELFGGFPPSFYAAYRDAWPLDAGYRVRRGLYNLYHVLNHLNLFGGSYAVQAERMSAALLSEIA